MRHNCCQVLLSTLLNLMMPMLCVLFAQWTCTTLLSVCCQVVASSLHLHDHYLVNASLVLVILMKKR